MKIILTTLTALLQPSLCTAQNNPPRLHFNLLSVKDGLPKGTVFDLLKDKEGYIWTGIPKDLVRYSGYATKPDNYGIKKRYAIELGSEILNNIKDNEEKINHHGKGADSEGVIFIIHLP